MLTVLIVVLIVENLLLVYRFRNKLNKIVAKLFKKSNIKNIQLEDETDAWYMHSPLLILHGAGGGMS